MSKELITSLFFLLIGVPISRLSLSDQSLLLLLLLFIVRTPINKRIIGDIILKFCFVGYVTNRRAVGTFL